MNEIVTTPYPGHPADVHRSVVPQRVRSGSDLVGNTPVLWLPGISGQPGVQIFVKLEEFNLTGSIKDRPVKEMLSSAIEAGELRPGMTVLVPSSGNTARAAAVQCSVLGYACDCVIPAATSPRKRADMARFGATLIEVPGETTEPAIEMAYRLKAERPDAYHLLDQYTNPANVRAHYLTTGPEILLQVPEITHLCAAQGSGGTLAGLGRRLQEDRPDVALYSVVAKPGTRMLAGMKESSGQGRPLVDEALLAGRLAVSGFEAAEAIQLGFAFGLQLGPSAGGALAAARRLARRLREGHIVVVCADSGGTYSDSLLYRRDARTLLSEDDANQEAATRW
jgi:cysteine synthase